MIWITNQFVIFWIFNLCPIQCHLSFALKTFGICHLYICGEARTLWFARIYANTTHSWMCMLWALFAITWVFMEILVFTAWFTSFCSSLGDWVFTWKTLCDPWLACTRHFNKFNFCRPILCQSSLIRVFRVNPLQCMESRRNRYCLLLKLQRISSSLFVNK